MSGAMSVLYCAGAIDSIVMAPKGSPEDAALDRFGREVIVAARDESIW